MEDVDTNSGEGQFEIRMLIDNHQVGGIIGKGGANVKRVREETNVFLSILKAEFRNVQERVMVLKGTVAQIARAATLIAELLVEVANRKQEEMGGTDTTEIRFLVQAQAVGAIIGKQGAVIKETQADTGARIKVSNEPLPQSTEKSVGITGTSEIIYQATLRVLAQLRDNPARSSNKPNFPYVPGQPMYAPPYGMPGYPQHQHSPYGGMPPQPRTPAHGGLGGAPGGEATNVQKIAIPTVCAGCVIGKGGAVISDLRARSGSNISIADPDPTSPTERVVTITGTTQGIQTAIYLIRQLVEQYQPQNY
jgi:heterogeneous nuclear rnp K-like protein 2